MTIAIDWDVKNQTKTEQTKWLLTQRQFGLKNIRSCARVDPALDKQQEPSHQQEVWFMIIIKFKA